MPLYSSALRRIDVGRATFAGSRVATMAALGTLTESTGGTGQDTMSVTTTTVGNLMVLCTTVGSTSKAVTAVSGGGADGTGWQRVSGVADTTNASVGITGMWWARVGSTGAQTINITYSVAIAGTSVERLWQEFTAGLGASTAWTLAASNITNDATTNASIAFPSLAGSGLYVGYGATQNGASAGVTAGFTYQIAPGFGDILTYKTAATGTSAPTATQSAGKSISYAGLWTAS